VFCECNVCMFGDFMSDVCVCVYGFVCSMCVSVCALHVVCVWYVYVSVNE